MEDERIDVDAAGADQLGSSPSVSASVPAAESALTKMNGPQVSTRAGRRPSPSRSKSGSASARGAARSAPSSP